ncbi:Protein of unknown function [Luteibacter sp. 329MFSha]|nr:Protein of unknown function [Luteibacter sp. 329MFSha]
MGKLRRLITWLCALKAQRLFAALCVGIVFARMIFPKLTFDSLSLYLILAAAACVMLPDMAKLLTQLRRAKFGGAELEFAIDSLAERTDAIAIAKASEASVEDGIEQLPAAPSPPTEGGADAEGDREWSGASGKITTEDLRSTPVLLKRRRRTRLYKQIPILAQLVEATDELTRNINERFTDNFGVPPPPKAYQALELLATTGLVDQDTSRLFRDLMRYRNKIVHGEWEITPSKIEKLTHTANEINSLIQDVKKINIHEAYELRYWTRQLGVSEEKLRQAVAKVGPSADMVRRELTRQKQHGEDHGEDRDDE